jgi:hypothetical protein
MHSTSVLSVARSVAGCFLLGLLIGCASGEKPQTASDSSASTRPDTVDNDRVIQSTGTIRYVDLEGGFYGLVAEDGTKYDPTPLPESLRVDGLQVRFRVKKKDAMTTRMWGTPVELLGAERIDDEND